MIRRKSPAERPTPSPVQQAESPTIDRRAEAQRIAAEAVEKIRAYLANPTAFDTADMQHIIKQWTIHSTGQPSQSSPYNIERNVGLEAAQQEAERRSPDDDLEPLRRLATDLYIEVLMLGPDHTYSYSIPTDVRNLMHQFYENNLKSVVQLYQSSTTGSDLSHQVEAIRTDAKQTMGQVAQEANLYTATESSLVLDHLNEFQQLLRLIVRHYRSSDRDNIVTAKRLLVELHKAEFNRLLDHNRTQNIQGLGDERLQPYYEVVQQVLRS